MSGVNEPFNDYAGSELWARKRIKKRTIRKTGLKNDTYFCAVCIDCCLFSTTFERGGNPMPACPLGSTPKWIQIEHPWILNRLSFVLDTLHEEVSKITMKKVLKESESKDTSAEVEDDD
jgi:hypothetical protein